MDSKVSMSRIIRFLALTSSSCGLQVLWSILLSSGTPFLISIGFDGALIALVWSIAPICGTFVQLWFGALSDRYQRRGVGRRAFLIGGGVATSISLVGFSMSRTQVEWLAQYFDRPLSDPTVRAYIKVNCIIWFCLVNVAIQPLQMASRAIIIENNDKSDQVVASAWASRMQGVGSILGFMLGSISLSEVLPLGLATNFTILCILGSVFLLATTLISASVIREEFDSVDPFLYTAEANGIGDRSRAFIEGIATMPRELWQVFTIQFFAWLGWFPFRTYYTSWLAGELAYIKDAADFELDLQAYAARIGSIAGLYLSTVAFVANCALPRLTTLLDRLLNSNGTMPPHWKYPKTPTKAILQIWLASHLYSAFVLFFAGMVGSQTGVILLISSLGLSWAVTLWVPFCLIGLLMSRKREHHLDSGTNGDHQLTQMGVVVGLHNAAISVPQILSALICSAVFMASTTANQGTLMVLLSGGCWMLVAAFALCIFFSDLQYI